MTTPSGTAPPPIDPAVVQQFTAMTCGAWVTQMLHVAAELELADALVGGERSVEQLAAGCGAHAPTLFRLLRALASLGVFAETESGRFTLTPLAQLLRRDHPASLRQFARLLGAEHYLSWDGLLDSVRSGDNAFRRRHGTDVFTWYAAHPARAEVFNGAMGDLSRLEVLAFLDAYPSFAEIRRLVDVGGCRGQLLEAVLTAHPHLNGTLFDQAAVVADLVPGAALAGRLDVEAGDFFSAVPAAADAYLLKHILHDWHDEACLTILGAIRRAMAPGARVLILEPVIPPGNAPFPGKLLDINMLVMTEGGRERTAEEYADLLQRGGFRLERIVPTAAAISVVEAFAAG